MDFFYELKYLRPLKEFFFFLITLWIGPFDFTLLQLYRFIEKWQKIAFRSGYSLLWTLVLETLRSLKFDLEVITISIKNFLIINIYHYGRIVGLVFRHLNSCRFDFCWHLLCFLHHLPCQYSCQPFKSSKKSSYFVPT